MICGFPRSVATGLLSLLIAQALERQLGGVFVGEKRPGGGAVTTTAPWTLLSASVTSLAVNATVFMTQPAM